MTDVTYSYLLFGPLSCLTSYDVDCMKTRIPTLSSFELFGFRLQPQLLHELYLVHAFYFLYLFPLSDEKVDILVNYLTVYLKII